VLRPMYQELPQNLTVIRHVCLNCPSFPHSSA